ncbi:hypothetical protein IHE61_12300 [Streptomyces sp. GKU 257-1]|nr:hypothetical protein [Streptomyces sp. GKU 257-1]
MTRAIPLPGSPYAPTLTADGEPGPGGGTRAGVPPPSSSSSPPAPALPAVGSWSSALRPPKSPRRRAGSSVLGEHGGGTGRA